jgi:hypothetical protein
MGVLQYTTDNTVYCLESWLAQGWLPHSAQCSAIFHEVGHTESSWVALDSFHTLCLPTCQHDPCSVLHIQADNGERFFCAYHIPCLVARSMPVYTVIIFPSLSSSSLRNVVCSTTTRRLEPGHRLHVIVRGQLSEPRPLHEQDARRTKEGSGERAHGGLSRPRGTGEIHHCILLLEKDTVPSIAQLEERGTVMEILCDPKVTGSTPVRRIFWPAVIILTMTHQNG